MLKHAESVREPGSQTHVGFRSFKRLLRGCATDEAWRRAAKQFFDGLLISKENLMQRLWPALIGLLALVVPAGASAQGDRRVDTMQAPHGGQTTVAGPLQLELVVDARELTLYLTGHADTPVDTMRGSAKAIITGGKDRYVVILSPAGENVLKGSGEYKLGSYNLISLMVALPDQDLQHATFVHPKGAQPPPKKARKSSGTKSSKKKRAQ